MVAIRDTDLETSFIPPPPIILAEELRIVIEGERLNRTVGANSSAHWRAKIKIKQAQRQHMGELVMLALQKWGGDRHTIPEEFLSRGGHRPIREAFPLEVEFIRYYGGRSQQADDDNIRILWKHYRDGLTAALGIEKFSGKGRDDNPNYMRAEYRQERTKDGRHALEIVVRLAKVTQEGATEAQEGGKEV